jgi:Xaa-Pro aminopeptidase
MRPRFSSQFFSLNRSRLRQLFPGKAPIVIAANGPLQRSGDLTYQFSQDPNFWYLTGLDLPNAILVIDGDSEYLIRPTRSASDDFFKGAEEDADLAANSGIKTIYDIKTGEAKLKARLKKVKHVATLAAPVPFIEYYGFYVNPARSALVAKLRGYNPELKLLDLSPHLIRLRSIKQPTELAAIKEAIAITIQSIKVVTRAANLKKYKYEYEVEAELLKQIRQRNANLAFDSIIASGANTTTLHYSSNNAQLRSQDLLLIDCGAEVNHYGADLTQTLSLGRPSKRQRAIYSATLEVQEYAISLLKPGVTLANYEAEVSDFMGEKLRELGLIKTINREHVRAYFPSLTSHFLGLNVHDVGDPYAPLQADMVLTVEPGIYISSEGLGVRLEDDILITETGAVNLSRNLPRAL